MLKDNAAFIRNNGRWLSVGFLLTFLSSFRQTLFIGLSGNDIRAAHGLSGGEFGSLYMVATLGSAMTLPWLGRTLDLMPGWKIVRFTMLSRCSSSRSICCGCSGTARCARCWSAARRAR